MKLYPLKFSPILKPTIWGGLDICKYKNLPAQEGIGESWEISCVEDNVSLVSNGELKGKDLQDLICQYKGQLVGNKNYQRFGTKFPLLIKFIDARDNLSIQVHPDDELAKKRHNSFGKTEMWYVIDAKEDAALYSGFAKKIDAEIYEKSIADDTFMDYIEKHDVKAGDVFFLPAGRVHAIGAGTFIAEIQQTSNITYRIYDYNRTDAAGNPRELHTELAKDAIDYNIYNNHKSNYQSQADAVTELETCQYFTTNLLVLTKEMKRDYSQIDSFVIYICMEGSCKIQADNGVFLEIKQGETVLIPAETKRVDISVSKNVKLLETFV